MTIPHQNPANLDELKRRIAARAYVVDPALVAGALVRRAPLYLLSVPSRPGAPVHRGA